MRDNIFQVISYFIMGYPLGMAVIWIICGLLFWWNNERKKLTNVENGFTEWPNVTILIPCHNESQIISNTCKQLLEVDYLNYRVIFIDDASSDQTAEVIREWTEKVTHFHLLRIEENQGKSNALNCAITVTANTPVIMIMDADTLPHPSSIKILVKSLMASPSIGAVTGHPIVYNRNNVLEKIQSIEFTAIIGLIKRAQNLYGQLFAVSGCMTAFKTEAIFKAGGFSAKTATEDIDITWRLQKKFYRIEFIPQAIAYIQVPDKLKEFWKQRKRWALGGWHLLRTHKDVFFRWEWRRLWLLYLDILLSYIWSLLFIVGGGIGVISFLLMNKSLGFNPFPTYGSFLLLVCLIQYIISFNLNRPYDCNIWKLLFWVPLYPVFYFWNGALMVCLMAVKGLCQDLGSVGKWRSPARINTTKRYRG